MSEGVKYLVDSLMLLIVLIHSRRRSSRLDPYIASFFAHHLVLSTQKSTFLTFVHFGYQETFRQNNLTENAAADPRQNYKLHRYIR